MSTAITNSAPIGDRVVDGDRRREAAVDVFAGADPHRLEDRRHRARRTHRRAGVAALEQDAGAAVEVGGGDAQRDAHLLDRAVVGLVADELRQRLAADQAAARDTTSRRTRSRPCRRRSRRARVRPCPRPRARRRGCRPRCRRRGRAGGRSPRAPGSRRCGRSRAPRRRRAPGRRAGGAAAAAAAGGAAAAAAGAPGRRRPTPPLGPPAQPASADSPAPAPAIAKRRSSSRRSLSLSPIRIPT